jgi:hypothetical protein
VVLWSTGKQAGPVAEDAGPDPSGYFQPRIMRHLHADGSVEYAIHDVYFRSNGSVDGYTAGSGDAEPAGQGGAQAASSFLYIWSQARRSSELYPVLVNGRMRIALPLL